jgi:hypothetical protein
VSEVGVTVAMAVLLLLTETVRDVWAVRLQPGLPSEPVAMTLRVVVPFGPPVLRDMISKVPSTVESRLLTIWSANAVHGTAKARAVTQANRP